jgi:hypothetical protein
MNRLEEIYNEKCNRSSDINEHLPTLKRYSEECEHITEMGVRNIVSTWAFLMGNPKKLISYDINPINENTVLDVIEGMGIDYKFILDDTTKCNIEETDFLFIDTLHNYNQMKAELTLHGNKVRKYIGFHDTTLFEINGESYNGTPQSGIWLAIEEFMNENPHWVLHERFTNNCGLTILKRI